VSRLDIGELFVPSPALLHPWSTRFYVSSKQHGVVASPVKTALKTFQIGVGKDANSDGDDPGGLGLLTDAAGDMNVIRHVLKLELNSCRF
jgi:hypothetical protein